MDLLKFKRFPVVVVEKRFCSSCCGSDEEGDLHGDLGKKDSGGYPAEDEHAPSGTPGT